MFPSHDQGVPFKNNIQRGHINDLMRKVDAKLSTNNIKATLDSLRVPGGDTNRVILERASEAIEPARKLYNEGAQIFEDIEAAGIIKTLPLKPKATNP